MKEHYKAYLDHIHPSAELLETTIKRVEKEKKLMDAGVKRDNTVDFEKAAFNKKRNKKKFYGYFAGAAAAAAAIIVTLNAGVFKSASPQINETADSIQKSAYTDISDEAVRSGLDSSKSEEMKPDNMELADYEKYIGINIEKLIGESTIKDKSIYAECIGDEIISEQSKFILSMGDKIIILELSKTNNIIPTQLETASSHKISGIDVHLGKDSEENKYYAAGNIHDIKFVITGYTEGDEMSEDEFEEAISEFLENMEPYNEEK